MTIEVEAIYSPTIMDGPVVRFQTGWKQGTYKEIFSGRDRTDWSAEVNASRNGVSIQGHWPTYTAPEQLACLKDLLDQAYEAHRQISQARSGGHDIAKAIVERFNAERAKVAA